VLDKNALLEILKNPWSRYLQFYGISQANGHQMKQTLSSIFNMHTMWWRNNCLLVTEHCPYYGLVLLLSLYYVMQLWKGLFNKAIV